MRTHLAILTLSLALVVSGPSFAQAKFSTEQDAQRHFPNDTVVWLNIPTGIYHLKGERWYGRTKNGAYVCEKDADQSGDRETRNGQ